MSRGIKHLVLLEGNGLWQVVDGLQILHEVRSCASRPVEFEMSWALKTHIIASN
jgi:hypothetical protein